MSRREQIESMLAADPQDQFLRYALAMEFDKESRHEESLALLAGLQADPVPHVPAYFMAAQQLVRLDRLAEARTLLRSGISLADQVGNTHAAGEMREFLTSLGNLGEA
ncbi:MAG: hypothetical protein SFX18_07555 [Pirellulales bacterium]|nr:hypothetical protein [Pirellulales bacterium]